MLGIKTITANFSHGSRKTITRAITQGDWGQQLKIKGIDLSSQVYEVHISNSSNPNKLAKQQVVSNSNTFDIPDEYLVSGQDIYIWLFLHETANDGETRYLITIPVEKKPKVIDEPPTPQEQSVITQAIAALNQAVAKTGQDVESADASAQAAADSAEQAREYKQETERLKTLAQEFAETASNEAQSATQSALAALASAGNAHTSQENANTYALISQAYAIGQKDGTPVQSTDETYHNNSKYYSQIAASKANEATQKSDEASEYASNASNSADEAQACESQAGDYADAANLSASNAAASASASLTSAVAAQNQANLSANSALQAERSAYQAQTSATAANTSRIAADNSASTALQYANEANSFMTSARQSADSAETAKQKAQAAAQHYPRVINGYWYVFDGSSGIYVNTNVKATGDTGNPGFSPIVNISKQDDITTISITDADGTTSAQILDGKSIQYHVCSSNEYNATTKIPTIVNPQENVFYLVPTGDSEGSDLFTEWVYVNNTWEKFGLAKIDLSNYVKKTDYATMSEAGVIKAHPDYGFTMDPFGCLETVPASTLEIMQSRGPKMITPAEQDKSVFYGLAKIAGDTTQNSHPYDYTYTDQAKAAIQNLLGVPSVDDIPEVPVTDVQLSGSSIVDQNGIVNITIGGGLTKSGSNILVQPATSNQIKGGTSNRVPIAPATQDYSTFYGLAKVAGADEKDSTLPVGQYTDNAKSAIQTMLGVPSTEDIPEIPVTDVQVDGTSIVNAQGVAELSIPSDGSGFGVVAINSAYGITVNPSTGQLRTNQASSSDIKNGGVNYKPVTTLRQHESTFYGLSKAAGVDLANETVTLGTYPATSQAAIKSMIGVNVDDVQINGTSIVSNGVAEIPLAGNEQYGVVQLSRTKGLYGLEINSSSGFLTTSPPTSSEIKNANVRYKPITPLFQHESTFYGLAKAAGDTTQSQSSNAVGQYTNQAKTAIKAMLQIADGAMSVGTVTTLSPGSDATASITGDYSDMELNLGIPRGQSGVYIGDTTPTDPTVNVWVDTDGNPDAVVTDVTVNGTSVVGADGVAAIPSAGASVPGVMKIIADYGITMTNGFGAISGASVEQAKAGTNNYKPIVPSREHLAAFYGLSKAAGDTTQSSSSNAVGTYTENAKSKIHEMLSGSIIITGTTPTINALPGLRYICGEVLTLTVNLPASGCVDVQFESGSTPTVLTVNAASEQTVKWANGFDPTSLETDTTYEINVADGLGVAVGWT